MNDHEIIQPIGQSHARWRPPFRALPVLADDHFSCLSLQRFRGKLCGRERTFVLQGSEIVGNGKIKAIWSVLPRVGDRRSFRAARRGRPLQASLQKGPTECSNLGSNDVAVTQ